VGHRLCPLCANFSSADLGPVNGQPEVVKEREWVYLLGMSNAAGEAFPPRCNMEDELDTLEEEREYLLDMCPVDRQETYDE
jgi:hypothetical protein